MKTVDKTVSAASGKKKKGKHMTTEDRVKIEYALDKGRNVSQIAEDLKRPPSTIMREIDRNCEISKARVADCIHINDCDLKHVCGDMKCDKTCSNACKFSCSNNCEYYEHIKCERLTKPPYVCNGCTEYKRRYCTLVKRFYKAGVAQTRYTNMLHDCRSGFDLTGAQLDEINRMASPLLKNGLSPYHVVQVLKDKVNISESTLYRLIKAGELDATVMDLREQVKRKPRKRRRDLHNEQKVTVSKVGRMYEDFLSFMEENDIFHVEMDCVEGKQNEPKTLLTLHWKSWQMQLAFIMDYHNSSNVVKVLDDIEYVLGQELFASMFPVILTDNGQEFTNIEGMERSVFDPDVRRTRIYFCEPNRSDEKGSCENNHKLIRTVIPKKKSLMPYIQADITLMMNHINSYKRKKALGKSAYDVAMAVVPEEFFDRLGLYKIDPNKIVLDFKLLRYARTRDRKERKALLGETDKNNTTEKKS